MVRHRCDCTKLNQCYVDSSDSLPMSHLICAYLMSLTAGTLIMMYWKIRYRLGHLPESIERRQRSRNKFAVMIVRFVLDRLSIFECYSIVDHTS